MLVSSITNNNLNCFNIRNINNVSLISAKSNDYEYTCTKSVMAPNYHKNIFFGSYGEKVKQLTSIIKSANYTSETLQDGFVQLSHTVQRNVREIVNKFKDEGLTLKDYLKGCSKYEQLFYTKPETLEKNVTGVVEKFANNGLTKKAYISACIKQPQLFYQKPDKIEKNVKGLIEKFKTEGLTVENYLPCCIKYPQLFYQSPKTIEQNIRNFVDIFKNNGLTTDSYLNAATIHPQLFIQSPQTIAKNIQGVVNTFKDNGLTTEQYLQKCLKLPMLFCIPSKTISEHINAYKYVLYCKTGVKTVNINQILSQILSYSTSLIYLRCIIRPQLRKQYPDLANLPVNGLKAKLEEYCAKHPEKQFEIKILQNEQTQNFIDVISKYAEEKLGRKDRFIFKIIDK